MLKFRIQKDEENGSDKVLVTEHPNGSITYGPLTKSTQYDEFSRAVKSFRVNNELYPAYYYKQYLTGNFTGTLEATPLPTEDIKPVPEHHVQGRLKYITHTLHHVLPPNKF